MIQDIEVYARNPDQILFDIYDDPALQPFVDKGDYEQVSVSEGDFAGVAMRLSRDGARRTVRRIIDEAQKQGADLKGWICGTAPEDFNLCAVLKELGWTASMVELRNFLKKKWVLWATTVGGIFVAGLLGSIITALSVLGFLSNELIEMCGCTP